MRAKEYLNRISDADRRLNAAIRKVNLYASLAENVTASIGGEQVTHTRDVTANERAIIRLAEAHDRVEQLRRERQAIVDDTVDTLDQMKDDECESLLIYHYVNRIPFPAVAKLMRICRSKIYMQHEVALQKLDALLENKDANGRSWTPMDANGQKKCDII